MAWHYVRDGVSQGPVEMSELQRLHQAGEVAGTTMVWTDGMAGWVPYQDSAAMAPAVLAGAVAVGSGPQHTCVECGRLLPESEMLHYENAWVCPVCKPVFFQRIREGVTTPGTLAYASVGRRFVAIVIDGILLYIVLLIPTIIIAGTGALTFQGRAQMPVTTSLWLSLCNTVVGALYEILMIGRFGATVGKMAMKVKVVTPEGAPISYARSTGRYFAKMLSGIILMIGYLMAFWDDQKRALHDRICQTRVVRSE
jgi:uncharacterized RDD family membrane protein YckC